MDHHDDKRQIRRHKREIKRLGNKRVRRQLKKDLAENPEEAHWSEVDLQDKLRSSTLNGLDRPADGSF